MRNFGLFYSLLEVDRCIERLRHAQGQSLLEAPNLGFPDFFRLMSKHADFAPFPDPDKPYFTLSQPTSIMLDLIAIWLYPVLVVAKVGLFASIVKNYSF